MCVSMTYAKSAITSSGNRDNREQIIGCIKHLGPEILESISRVTEAKQKCIKSNKCSRQ